MFRNPTSDPQLVTYRFRFPAAHATYDGLGMELNGRPLPAASEKEDISIYCAACAA